MGATAMNNSHNALACQLQAITEFAVSHLNESDLRKLVDNLLNACTQIEHAVAAKRKVRAEVWP